MKIFRYTVLLLLINSLITVNAQIYQGAQHAIQVGSSDNSAVLTGVASVNANPAASLHQKTEWDFSLTADRRFGTDIQSLAASFTKKTGNNAFGMLVGKYGIDEFNTRQLTLGYSRSIGSQAYLGIQGHYHQLFIEGLGRSDQTDITVGYWQIFIEKVVFSFYVKNPLQALRREQRLFGKTDLGLGLIVSDRTQLYCSIDKPWGHKISFRPGFSYQPINSVRLFVSASTSPSALSFGAKIRMAAGWRSELGVNTHPILGNSLAFSLGYIIH